VHSYSASLTCSRCSGRKTRSYFSANTVDATPRLLAALQVYGSQALLQSRIWIALLIC
jgi:hypothetical protein